MAEKIIDFISGKEVNATPEEVEAVQVFAQSLLVMTSVSFLLD